MTEAKKVPCNECGKLVLPATVDRTGGFCMPCFKKRQAYDELSAFEINRRLSGGPVLPEADSQKEAAWALRMQEKLMSKLDRMIDDDTSDLEQFVKDFQQTHKRAPSLQDLPDNLKASEKQKSMAQAVLAFSSLQNQYIDDVGDEQPDLPDGDNYIKYTQVKQAIASLQTKFGGQPVWLQGPAWPLSRSTGNKMTFIGQIVLDTSFAELQGKVIYFFMNTDEDADETWDADAGENAVIVQPGDNKMPCVTDATGPAAQHAYDTEFDERGLCEFSIELTDLQNAESDDRIGGTPSWWQAEESPYPDAIFVTQLSDGSLPLDVNFGVGSAYVFLNSEGTEGKLLWQCS